MTQGEKRSRGRPRLHQPNEQVAGVQTLDRAVTVLQIVSNADGLSLSEISERASLPSSTVYRLLTTLQSHHMAEFNENQQLWHVGVETFRIGSSFLRRRKLADRSRDVLRGLQGCCGETANLALADHDGVVFVSQVETHLPIRAFFRPGTRGDYHSSGIGKAILAYAAPEIVKKVKRGPLEVYTQYTIKTPEELDADLEAIRKRGWSIDNEERHVGMRCIAVPIFNEYSEPLGGISVSGPAVRVTPEMDSELGPKVLCAAKEFTDMIGGIWPGAILD